VRGRCRRSARDLDAATTDVDDHAGARGEVGAVGGGQVDQPGLFDARDHAGANAGRLGHGGEEVATVRGFASGAGRGGDDLVHVVRVGQALELRHRGQAGGHGGVGQTFSVESARAKAYHVFLSVDDLEREVRADPDNDHVDGVGADVDRGNAHGEDL
jgi:hypothetical protein